jgi:hypothetical protein
MLQTESGNSKMYYKNDFTGAARRGVRKTRKTS